MSQGQPLRCAGRAGDEETSTLAREDELVGNGSKAQSPVSRESIGDRAFS